MVPEHSKILAAGFLEYRDSVGKGAILSGAETGRSGWQAEAGMFRSGSQTTAARCGLVDIDKVTVATVSDFHSLRRLAVTALKHARHCRSMTLQKSLATNTRA